MTKQMVYIPVKIEDETLLANKIYNFVNEIDEEKILFSDKFNEEQINDKLPQALGFDLIKEQEGYFFTPEQLNEYTANVIKDALNTAAENAYVDFEDYDKEFVNKKSITNTFEEIFKKFEVRTKQNSMNIDKEFVPYTESLELKELGFDEPCFGRFDGRGKNKGKIWYEMPNTGQDSIPVGDVLAPTYSQAFRWFREKHNWQNSIDPTADQYNHQLGYNYWIWNYKTGEEHHTMPKNRPTGDWEYETYEEAELACLKKLIELVKNK